MAAIETDLATLRTEFRVHAQQTAEGMARIADELHKNTATTDAVREIVETGRALFRLGGWIGAFLKWTAPITVAALAMWHAVRGWKP